MINNVHFQDYSGGYSNYNPPPPVQGYNQQGYRTPNNQGASANSILSLIFGIMSYMVCPIIFGIIAWIFGKIELNKIKRGESSISGNAFAKAGMWLGIINVIIFALLIIGYLIFFFIYIQHTSDEFEKWINV